MAETILNIPAVTFDEDFVTEYKKYLCSGVLKDQEACSSEYVWDAPLFTLQANPDGEYLETVKNFCSEFKGNQKSIISTLHAKDDEAVMKAYDNIRRANSYCTLVNGGEKETDWWTQVQIWAGWITIGYAGLNVIDLMIQKLIDSSKTGARIIKNIGRLGAGAVHIFSDVVIKFPAWGFTRIVMGKEKAKKVSTAIDRFSDRYIEKPIKWFLFDRSAKLLAAMAEHEDNKPDLDKLEAQVEAFERSATAVNRAHVEPKGQVDMGRVAELRARLAQAMEKLKNGGDDNEPPTTGTSGGTDATPGTDGAEPTGAAFTIAGVTHDTTPAVDGIITGAEHIVTTTPVTTNETAYHQPSMKPGLFERGARILFPNVSARPTPALAF